MDFGADAKVAKKIQDKFKELCPSSSLFLSSVDDDESKYDLSLYYYIFTNLNCYIIFVGFHCM